MLATAAKLSRALAATFDVLLSELALEVQPEALLLVTQYPLPASAGDDSTGTPIRLGDNFGSITVFTRAVLINRFRPRRTGSELPLILARIFFPFHFTVRYPKHCRHRSGPD